MRNILVMMKPCFGSRGLRHSAECFLRTCQISTLAVVGFTCLVAIGCTAQFKRMPNRPLELAFDDGPSDIVAETQEPVAVANTLRHEDEAPKETAPEENVGEKIGSRPKLPSSCRWGKSRSRTFRPVLPARWRRWLLLMFS